jgi:hypothetical protein
LLGLQEEVPNFWDRSQNPEEKQNLIQLQNTVDSTSISSAGDESQFSIEFNSDELKTILTFKSETKLQLS